MVSRVIIIPGNGCVDVRNANWYYWLQQTLQKSLKEKGIETIDVVLRTMPDPFTARKKIWLPFIIDELKCDENTIVVGHSSGAEAIMRLLETKKVKGAILVSACHTDLGIKNERKSGYYKDPWQWEDIKRNADWIVQFGSEDDPFIPWHEMEHVHTNLGTDFRRYTDAGHFQDSEFPVLHDLVMEKILSS